VGSLGIGVTTEDFKKLEWGGGLPGQEKIIMLFSSWIQYMSVTDGHTDRLRPIASIPRLRIASRGKNYHSGERVAYLRQRLDNPSGIQNVTRKCSQELDLLDSTKSFATCVAEVT